MKAKVLVRCGLFIQCVYLLFLLFRAPEISGGLKLTRDELQQGDADLPALSVFNADGKESTLAYDPLKTPCQNLAARAVLRLSGADRGYGMMLRVTLLASLLNIIVSVCLVRSFRSAPTIKRGQSTEGHE